MILNVEIKNNVATYIPTDDEKPVCGNGGNKVKFTFDEEWEGHEKKTARFGWSGHYFDKEFEGDTVDVPVITNATKFTVGVYVGEPATDEDEDVLSTTKATIPCRLSVRCDAGGAHAGTGANYTNEARGYAAEAKAAAAEAEASAEQTAKYHGMKEVGRATINVELHESYTDENGDMYDALVIDGTRLDKNNNLIVSAQIDSNDEAILLPIADAELRKKILRLFNHKFVSIEIYHPYDVQNADYMDVYCYYREVATGKDHCETVNAYVQPVEWSYSTNRDFTGFVSGRQYMSASWMGDSITALHLSDTLAETLKGIFAGGTTEFYEYGGYVEIVAYD